MRPAIAIGLFAGLTVAFVAVVLVALGYSKCIDSPKFLNPPPLVVASAGIGLITTGAIGLGGSKHSRLSAVLLGFGVLIVAFALAGPPYNSCIEWEGFIRP